MMDIECNTTLVAFDKADYGAALIGIVGGKALWGVKAFSGEGEERQSWFVALGPQTDTAENQPCVYHPNNIRHPWMLDLTGSCRFTPSISPDDILAELPHVDTCAGAVLLLADQILLGVIHDIQGLNRTLFLNPETGKLDVGPQHIFFCATRRWKLVEPTVHGEKILFDYTAPI